MADPSAVSIVIPAYNEADVIGEVVAALTTAARWHEIIVVDDGSHDATSQTASSAGATVVTHPYNKGNGAAVKSGIRRATGEYVLIVDGDGQHRPEDARRLVARLGEYSLVIGARSASTQATHARRFRNGALNWLASYLTGRDIPDLTSGFRGARREYLSRIHPSAAQRILDADNDDAGVHQRRIQRRIEPVEARSRIGESKIRLARDGTKFLMIILKIVTLFSRCGSSCRSAWRRSRWAPPTPSGRLPRRATSRIRRCSSSCWRSSCFSSDSYRSRSRRCVSRAGNNRHTCPPIRLARIA